MIFVNGTISQLTTIKKDIYMGKNCNCTTCTCENPDFHFDCTCDHSKKFPGDIQYTCEYCGIYTASKPKCNKCEAEN